MKTRNLTSLIGTLLLAASANFMLVSECSAIEKVNSSSKNGITPETDSILAQNAANALRQLASARSDISKNNIPGAQAAIGKTLDCRPAPRRAPRRSESIYSRQSYLHRTG